MTAFCRSLPVALGLLIVKLGANDGQHHHSNWGADGVITLVCKPSADTDTVPASKKLLQNLPGV
jgi:hypothetical protein